MRSDGIVFGVLFALALTVIQRVLGFARGVLFCHFMTDQQLGQFSLIYSWLLTLAPLAVLGMPGTFGRFLEEFRQKGSIGSFLRIVGRMSAVSTLVMAATMMLFPSQFSWQILGTGNQIDLIWAAAGGLILLTGYNYLVSLIESMRQIRLATMMRFVSGAGFTVIGVAALWLAHPAWSTLIAVVAFGLSSMLGALPALWYLHRYRHDLCDCVAPLKTRQVLGRIGPYAAWWWMSNLLQNLYELMDRYMLVHWSNTDTVANVQSVVGQYHSGRVIPMMLAGLAEMVRGLLLPYLTAAWLKGDAHYVRQQLNWVIKLLALGLLVTGAGFLLASHWLFDTLLEGRYADGLAVMPLTMVYCIWISIAIVGQDFLWIREKGRWANAVFAGGLVVNLVLNASLIPTYGLWGAVIATALANGIVLVALFWMNAHFGCRLSSACWWTSAIPLVLLLPPWPACVATASIVILAASTTFYFSADERRQFHQLIQTARTRLGF